MGCGRGFGFSSTRDDCDDTSKEIHPGVKEMCNARDDDCNGRVDDGARAACGAGLVPAPGAHLRAAGLRAGPAPGRDLQRLRRRL